MKRLDQRKLKLDKVVLRKLDAPQLAAVRGGNGYHSSCGFACGCEEPPVYPFPITAEQPV